MWSFRTEESSRIQWNIWPEWCNIRFGSEIFHFLHCYQVIIWYTLTSYHPCLRLQVTILDLRWSSKWSNKSPIYPTNIWWIFSFDHEDLSRVILRNKNFQNKKSSKINDFRKMSLLEFSKRNLFRVYLDWRTISIVITVAIVFTCCRLTDFTSLWINYKLKVVIMIAICP